jgi:choice-of-anchor C domain-containing protein
MPGNNCITGWTVGPHSVDLINGYWEAKDGTHSIDLSGNAPGSIMQTFNTVSGELYTVNYWLSGNPDGGDATKFGLISAVDGGIVQSATFLGLQGSSHSNMNYLPWTFSFTATGAQTTLSFAGDGSDGAYGAVLDAVQVIAPVPEPATWAMMLFGFGAIGFAMRRRKDPKGVRRVRLAYS